MEENLQKEEPVTTVEEFTIEELLTKFGLATVVQNSDETVLESIEEYVNSLIANKTTTDEVKRKAEAEVLQFRIRLKSRLTQMAGRSSKFAKSIALILRDFDTHFNITAKRQGNV